MQNNLQLAVNMVVGEQLDKVFRLLQAGFKAEVGLGESLVVIQPKGSSHSVELSTEVYYGGNYIPGSVRRAAQRGVVRGFGMPMNLRIDETHFRIFLVCQSVLDQLEGSEFAHLLGGFSSVAEEWRAHLDGHDKNDLVYINVK